AFGAVRPLLRLALGAVAPIEKDAARLPAAAADVVPAENSLVGPPRLAFAGEAAAADVADGVLVGPADRRPLRDALRAAGPLHRVLGAQRRWERHRGARRNDERQHRQQQSDAHGPAPSGPHLSPPLPSANPARGLDTIASPSRRRRRLLPCTLSRF